MRISSSQSILSTMSAPEQDVFKEAIRAGASDSEATNVALAMNKTGPATPATTVASLLEGGTALEPVDYSLLPAGYTASLGSGSSWLSNSSAWDGLTEGQISRADLLLGDERLLSPALDEFGIPMPSDVEQLLAGTRNYFFYKTLSSATESAKQSLMVWRTNLGASSGIYPYDRQLLQELNTKEANNWLKHLGSHAITFGFDQFDVWGTSYRVIANGAINQDGIFSIEYFSLYDASQKNFTALIGTSDIARFMNDKANLSSAMALYGQGDQELARATYLYLNAAASGNLGSALNHLWDVYKASYNDLGDLANVVMSFAPLAALRTGRVVAANRGGTPVVLDLFGGRTSQIPGAINVDIAATQGVRASATQLPFRAGIADEVIASNPYIPGGSGMMDFLPGAAQTLKPGGQLIINATQRNPFGVLPDAKTLQSLGLRVVQENGPLLPRFENNVFRFTDGRIIPNTSVRTTILERAQQ